jgi:hypothetical protein
VPVTANALAIVYLFSDVDTAPYFFLHAGPGTVTTQDGETIAANSDGGYLYGDGAARVDGSCTTNSTVFVGNAAAVATDVGRKVTGTNIPAGAYVVSVSAGVSWTLNTAATGTASGLTMTSTSIGPDKAIALTGQHVYRWSVYIDAVSAATTLTVTASSTLGPNSRRMQIKIVTPGIGKSIPRARIGRLTYDPANITGWTAGSGDQTFSGIPSKTLETLYEIAANIGSSGPTVTAVIAADETAQIPVNTMQGTGTYHSFSGLYGPSAGPSTAAIHSSGLWGTPNGVMLGVYLVDSPPGIPGTGTHEIDRPHGANTIHGSPAREFDTPQMGDYLVVPGETHLQGPTPGRAYWLVALTIDVMFLDSADAGDVRFELRQGGRVLFQSSWTALTGTLTTLSLATVGTVTDPNNLRAHWDWRRLTANHLRPHIANVQLQFEYPVREFDRPHGTSPGPAPNTVTQRGTRRLRALPRSRRGRSYPIVPAQLSPPYPFVERVQPRQLRGLTRQRRGRSFTVTPPQLNPPYPFVERVLPRRLRGLRFRRAKFNEVVPVQLQPLPPVTEIAQSRRLRGMRVRRAKLNEVIPDQLAPVQYQPQPRRVRGMRVRRGKSNEVVPPQLNPPYPFSELTQPRRVRGMRVRRGRLIEVVPAQETGIPNPAFTTSVVQPRRLRAMRVRRGRLYELVPAQQNPPYPFSETAQPHRLRGLFRQRRGKLYEVVPAQLNPPFPFSELVQPRRVRLMRVRRSKLNEVIPDQQAPTPNPPYTTNVTQPRQLRGMARQRRGQAFTVTPPQLNPPYPFNLSQQSRHRYWILRRSRQARVVPPQLNPPIVLVTRQPRRLRGLFRWRKRFNQVTPPQEIQPTLPNDWETGPFPF